MAQVPGPYIPGRSQVPKLRDRPSPKTARTTSRVIPPHGLPRRAPISPPQGSCRRRIAINPDKSGRHTILDEKFVNLVSTYHNELHEFGSLVRDAEQFGNSSSSPGQETISAVIFAAQHVPSAMVVLALLKVNSCRDDFTDEEILEAFNY
ncbi:hypothetical protein CIB48_g10028 [Xylaria polymorpha]|nr:hypothetical protein CIB48_g10028 [Xylaria polymorpha]